jgi:hypothetical protein
MNDDKNEKGEPSNGAAKYEVGNKKPPTHSQFKKGLSGNPGGRPKGRRSFKSLLAAELNSTVKVCEGGKYKTVTKKEAIAKQFVGKALKGEYKAIGILMPHILATDVDAEKAESKVPQLKEINWTEAHEKLLQELEADIQQNRDETIEVNASKF